VRSAHAAGKNFSLKHEGKGLAGTRALEGGYQERRDERKIPFVATTSKEDRAARSLALQEKGGGINSQEKR